MAHKVDMKGINKLAECQIGATPEAQRDQFLSMDTTPPVLALATALGETRSGLARRTGISLSTLAKWDAGSVSPRRRQIGKLLSGSPVTEDEFLARFDAFHPGVMGRVKKKRVAKEKVTKIVTTIEPTALRSPSGEAEEDDWGAL